jgi:serine/threonine-protein kinase RsbW
MKKQDSTRKISTRKKPAESKKTTPQMAQQLELGSTSDSINIVEKLIETICTSYKVNENHYGNILVAVTEAVNNAIYHGNKSDPGKKIHIAFRSDPSKITFTVRDEGRGVFLMHRLADQVEFSENGNCVSLKFDLSAN